MARFMAISSDSSHAYSGDLHSSKAVSLNDKVYLLADSIDLTITPQMVRKPVLTSLEGLRSF